MSTAAERRVATVMILVGGFLAALVVIPAPSAGICAGDQEIQARAAESAYVVVPEQRYVNAEGDVEYLGRVTEVIKGEANSWITLTRLFTTSDAIVDDGRIELEIGEPIGAFGTPSSAPVGGLCRWRPTPDQLRAAFEIDWTPDAGADAGRYITTSNRSWTSLEMIDEQGRGSAFGQWAGDPLDMSRCGDGETLVELARATDLAVNVRRLASLAVETSHQLDLVTPTPHSAVVECLDESGSAVAVRLVTESASDVHVILDGQPLRSFSGVTALATSRDGDLWLARGSGDSLISRIDWRTGDIGDEWNVPGIVGAIQTKADPDLALALAVDGGGSTDGWLHVIRPEKVESFVADDLRAAHDVVVVGDRIVTVSDTRNGDLVLQLRDRQGRLIDRHWIASAGRRYVIAGGVVLSSFRKVEIPTGDALFGERQHPPEMGRPLLGLDPAVPKPVALTPDPGFPPPGVLTVVARPEVPEVPAARRSWPYVALLAAVGLGGLTMWVLRRRRQPTDQTP